MVNPTTFYTQAADPGAATSTTPTHIARASLYPEQIAKLKVQCRDYLKDLGLKRGTRKYEDAIMWFWMGALAGRGMPLADCPSIAIMLMSGRVNELVAE
jgi:hypothetical protein